MLLARKKIVYGDIGKIFLTYVCVCVCVCIHMYQKRYLEKNMRLKEAICGSVKFSVVAARVAAVAAAAVITAQLPNTAIVCRNVFGAFFFFYEYKK